MPRLLLAAPLPWHALPWHVTGSRSFRIVPVPNNPCLHDTLLVWTNYISRFFPSEDFFCARQARLLIACGLRWRFLPFCGWRSLPLDCFIHHYLMMPTRLTRMQAAKSWPVEIG